MTLLIVIIGLLNIGLGFGLAMYYGYGPPGLEEIFEAIGPMPPGVPSAQSLVSGGIVASESTVRLSANLPASSTIDPPAESLAEETVLGEVRDLATTAQSALVSDQVESRE